MSPTFSIITVVRNDPAGAVRTLQSVFAQTCADYELIVQDGASTDETSDLLRRFAPWIDSLVIEPDGGIYDAMNRALARATGDWLLFLNAGDFFRDKEVLAEVAGEIGGEGEDIFAGRVKRDEDGKVHGFRPPDKFWAGNTCDHQATFIARDWMQRFGYREEFRVCGDLDFFTRARQEGARFRYHPVIVARRPMAVGASSGFVDRLQDRFAMLEQVYGAEYPVRETLTQEMVVDTARATGFEPEDLAPLSLEELFTFRERWERRVQSRLPRR
ncbi:hypothetical protein OG2516_18925 [Oceanicola granulosus HTCC2516]|uniref:Glycosyltransferase 2-like domain-containing protein n=1 Tax=Oceanicola granulosus (strain ATCC BAA-861 / DSM 15982 / KCTC 12143 / HTCC2516) TaxID=314256 RepID=Q2CBT3_OCEGH|nr:glycosyltransferase family 2 protein [Oceanicola granulosus]EAR50121.1 hypothetical protein OG2516_18925 [Oceanicola granulosus HTCC2516]